MHRLTIDEGWQWMAGAPATLVRLNPDGTGDSTTLGPDSPQALVTKGSWMGARTHGEWTLFSCWCAPAFEPEHFELGERSALLDAFPDHGRRDHRADPHPPHRSAAMTALVTGASGGLGRAIAVALAVAGHDIGVHYRSDAVGAAAAVTDVEAVGRRSAAPARRPRRRRPGRARPSL
jgi:hypothetical protein